MPRAHLFEHLSHRAARADDVGEVVAFLQLFLEVQVLVAQTSPLAFDQLGDAKGLPE